MEPIMAKKIESKGGKVEAIESQAPQTLGAYLANIRTIRRLKLRDVEKATDHEVSNGYLSQLETNKISKPSPNILHALAKVYMVPYETLMEKAGYLSPSNSSSSDSLRSAATTRHGRAATFADENLTRQEEEMLLEYLAFLRSRRANGKA
jgi:HTH-type transcriptional regulator, competence development regulator